jgi:nucleoside 2-deoxyribosyltransferase
MPFRPELNFFYRAIKSHIEQTFPEVRVERGDDRVLTKPILEKIVDFIRQADVVIADCSGRNPNVFYELGIAHALEKPACS